MMKKKLEPSVDSISALREEKEVLRCREEPVVGDGLKESHVSFLEDQRRPPGMLGAGESREPTRRRRTEILSGGRNRLQPLEFCGGADRNGIWRGFGSSFDSHDLSTKQAAFGGASLVRPLYHSCTKLGQTEANRA